MKTPNASRISDRVTESHGGVHANLRIEGRYRSDNGRKLHVFTPMAATDVRVCVCVSVTGGTRGADIHFERCWYQPKEQILLDEGGRPECVGFRKGGARLPLGPAAPTPVNYPSPPPARVKTIFTFFANPPPNNESDKNHRNFTQAIARKAFLDIIQYCPPDQASARLRQA